MRRRTRVNKLLVKITSERWKCSLRNELVKIEVALQKSLNNFAFSQEQKAIDSIKRNPKYFFSYVKKFSKVKCNIGPLQKENNDYTADSKEMADLLAKQYTKVFSKPEDTTLDPTMVFFDVKTWRMKDEQISVDDITREIDNTSSCASSGPDSLPIKLFQKSPSLSMLGGRNNCSIIKRTFGCPDSQRWQ